MNRPILIGYQLLIGMSDTSTGAMLIVAPELTLRLMHLHVPSDALPFLSFIGAFVIFEPVHIITDGGPGNSTETIVQYIYEKGFTQLHMGYAATLGLVVLVVLLLATLVQFGLARFWVHNEVGD